MFLCLVGLLDLTTVSVSFFMDAFLNNYNKVVLFLEWISWCYRVTELKK